MPWARTNAERLSLPLLLSLSLSLSLSLCVFLRSFSPLCEVLRLWSARRWCRTHVSAQKGRALPQAEIGRRRRKPGFKEPALVRTAVRERDNGRFRRSRSSRLPRLSWGVWETEKEADSRGVLSRKSKERSSPAVRRFLCRGTGEERHTRELDRCQIQAGGEVRCFQDLLDPVSYTHLRAHET